MGQAKTCGIELGRVNDEVPNVNYHCVMADFLEMSLQYDSGVAQLFAREDQKGANNIPRKTRRGRRPNPSPNGVSTTRKKMLIKVKLPKAGLLNKKPCPKKLWM